MAASRTSPAWVLTAGAALFAGYVLTHPRGAVEEANDVEEAVRSMAVEPAWVVSHLIGLAAVVLIGIGAAMLLRRGWLDGDPRARRAGWLLCAGAFAAAVELVPHTVVTAETDALASGGSTPWTDLHLLFQATLLPVYGLGVAALAAFGFRRVAHPAACVLGVVGGVALILVGPLLFLTDDPALGKVFMPAGGTVVFLLAAGVRLLQRDRRLGDAAVGLD